MRDEKHMEKHTCGDAGRDDGVAAAAEGDGQETPVRVGVADVAFWHLHGENNVVADMENGIVLSDPCYEPEDWLCIGRKQPDTRDRPGRRRPAGYC